MLSHCGWMISCFILAAAAARIVASGGVNAISKISPSHFHRTLVGSEVFSKSSASSSSFSQLFPQRISLAPPLWNTAEHSSVIVVFVFLFYEKGKNVNVRDVSTPQRRFLYAFLVSSLPLPRPDRASVMTKTLLRTDVLDKRAMTAPYR